MHTILFFAWCTKSWPPMLCQWQSYWSWQPIINHYPASMQWYWGRWSKGNSCRHMHEVQNTSSPQTWCCLGRVLRVSWHSGVRIWHYAAKANEDYRFVSGQRCKFLSHNSITLAKLHHPPVQERSCQLLSAKSCSRYLTTSNKHTQDHGFVVMPAAANSPTVQHETPPCLCHKNWRRQRGWGH